MQAIRIATWNIQGGERPDLEVLHETLCEHEPDIVVLQEVERHQVQHLAGIGEWSWAWHFKHWPIVRAPQGQAVLATSRLAHHERIVLAHRWGWCWWRRRIAVIATVSIGTSTLQIVNAHLGAAVADAVRARQAEQVVARLGDGRTAVVAGDLNAEPDSSTVRVLRDAGFTDEIRSGSGTDGRGPTNWSPGPRSGPPSQWLDHVFVGPGLAIRSVQVPQFGEAGFERYPALSDHLPVVVEVTTR